MSVKAFFTSPRSASRTISSTWVWNSAAMRRAFLIMLDMVRIAAGMSLGPIAINATAPIKTISDQAKSNMGVRVSPGGAS